MADEPVVPVVIERHADMVDVVTTGPHPVEPDPVAPDDTVTGAEGTDTIEGAEGDDDTPLPDEKGKRKNDTQARIDELTRKAADATRRAAQAEKAAAELKQPPSDKDASTEPDEADFDTYGAFVKAVVKWDADQRDAKRAETEATQAHEAAATDRSAAWGAKVAATTIPDYDEVVGTSEIPIKDHVAEALMEAERGPELAYHLASHPEVADRLNTMSPMSAAIELGRIEATLGGPPPRATTKAPAPITPITPGPSGKVNLATADQDTYMAERRRQGARW